jgi:hypothetical protein
VERGVSASEWLSPPTRWRGVDARGLRRDAGVWAVWFLAWSGLWVLLGKAMFRWGVLPDSSAPLLVLLLAALVMAFVSFVFAGVRFLVSLILAER